MGTRFKIRKERAVTRVAEVCTTLCVQAVAQRHLLLRSLGVEPATLFESKPNRPVSSVSRLA